MKIRNGAYGSGAKLALMKYFFLTILALVVLDLAVKWAWLVNSGQAIMVLDQARPYRAGTLKKETTCHYFTGTSFFTVHLRDEVRGVRCQPMLKQTRGS